MATRPASAHELTGLQQALGELTPARWQPPATLRQIGACFICFERQELAAQGIEASPAPPSPLAAACWPG